MSAGTAKIVQQWKQQKQLFYFVGIISYNYFTTSYSFICSYKNIIYIYTSICMYVYRFCLSLLLLIFIRSAWFESSLMCLLLYLMRFTHDSWIIDTQFRTTRRKRLRKVWNWNEVRVKKILDNATDIICNKLEFKLYDNRNKVESWRQMVSVVSIPSLRIFASRQFFSKLHFSNQVTMELGDCFCYYPNFFVKNL